MVLIVLFALFCFLGFTLLGLGLLFRKLNDKWAVWNWRKRLISLATGVAVITTPYLAFKAIELCFVLARVPDPLHVMLIEYRLEEARGIGLPGDNETGFIVYRLTKESARWARENGRSLDELLPGRPGTWKPTPIARWADGSQRWHPYNDEQPVRTHRADIREYLGKYGFNIPVEQRRVDEFNRAVRTLGSFYSYGRGGSVTVVDPEEGKVFFAYAG